ncbi:exopolyphosphatase [Altererythrobacter sp. SALINAS58]|uniref:Ppx/GppA phosphatase family protein n=1 Tax=Alteripontixanthobacter muriae TaxID=2705546 RepID=UPI0015759549|nr:exopolyphosphatase [Alteripontixanthobacter muriae]NTZ42441.1 exopolyphosphatase [Alteripontixanthobacter muriae]
MNSLDENVPSRKGERIVRRTVVDIGSNTVRLVIYGGPPRAPQIVHNEKVSARLGRELSETGIIPDKAASMALDALRRYALLVEDWGVQDVTVVATAAVRDASNGREFLEAVRATGFAPRLLSGREEAETSAEGVLGAFPGAQGIVADLGGGSLELVNFGRGSVSHGISAELGTLRLPALRGKNPARTGANIGKILRGSGFEVQSGQVLYLVGGSLRAFGRLVMVQTGSPLEDSHGFEVDTETARRIAARIADRKPAELGPIPGVSSSRLAMLPDAAALLLELIDMLAPSELVFSAWGLREGLLHRAMTPKTRSRDPLLSGVSEFSASHGVPLQLATILAGWIAAVHNGKEADREHLRLVAIMLGLASRRLETNLRDRHVIDWALHKRWIGIRPKERAMLAAALLAQNGKTTLPAELGKLCDAGALHDAQAWGFAIRLCRRLAGCSIRSLVGSKLSIEEGTLVLRLAEDLLPLFTDGSRKDLRILAEHLDLDYRQDILSSQSR